MLMLAILAFVMTAAALKLVIENIFLSQRIAELEEYERTVKSWTEL